MSAKRRAEHTPGPWTVFPSGSIGSASVRTLDAIVIRSGTVKGATIAEGMANARLIAAAPRLLEALKRLANTAGEPSRNWPEFNAALAEADAAVAEAEG